MVILALCDSPTLETTGFSKVAQPVFRRWAAAGHIIDCWGIGFNGWHYRKHDYIREIFPAGTGADWHQVNNLQLFIVRLLKGDYTHVWIMQDSFQLVQHDFPNALREACAMKGAVSCLYFPVDAPLEHDWGRIIQAVDVPVAYTEYGRDQALRILSRADLQRPIEVIPHGVDTSIYNPGAPGEREALREKYRWQRDKKSPERRWLKPDDFLILNVNANQRRKDPARSLEILAELKRRGFSAKLLMHMPRTSGAAGVDLEAVGEQLGLKLGVDWTHNGGQFRGGIGLRSEEQLVDLYRMADLYLTTTLGEGWGLGITEALACGLPVAIPQHTACRELAERLNEKGMGERVLPLPVEEHGVFLEADNSRRRHRVAINNAAGRIVQWWLRNSIPVRPALNDEVREWLSWDRIAARFIELMQAARPHFGK